MGRIPRVSNPRKLPMRNMLGIAPNPVADMAWANKPHAREGRRRSNRQRCSRQSLPQSQRFWMRMQKVARPINQTINLCRNSASEVTAWRFS